MIIEPRYVPTSLTNYIVGQVYNYKNRGSIKVVILTKELRERDARGSAHLSSFA
jgi:hypothetical protein